jgi:short-subunit dehydrogenase
VARRRERLDAVLADCRTHTPASAAWVADLADTERAAAVALEAWDGLGPLDCLVNNAGVPMRRHTTRLDYGTLEWVMRVNFLAPARMTLALLPKMTERGAGIVVNVSSVAGRSGTPTKPPIRPASSPFAAGARRRPWTSSIPASASGP